MLFCYKSLMREQVYSIQAIRALAATMVVISHVGRALLLKAGTDVTDITVIGSAGVDLFFVVSGFIMVHTTARPFDAGRFMRQRITRIAPLYWLVTLFYGAAMLAVPAIFHLNQFQLSNFVMSLLFLPAYNAAGDLLPPLEQGWTLVYEMFFYLVFAVASKLAFGRRIGVISGVFAILVGAGLVLRPTANAFVLTYTNPLLFEFILGCALASLYGCGRLTFPPVVAAGCVAIAIAGFALSGRFVGTPYPRLIYWGVPALLMVLGFLRLERIVPFDRMRGVQAVGNASYSIYLTHVLVLSVLALSFHFSASKWHGGIPLAPVFLAICLLMGWFCYRVIEKPLTVFARRHLVSGRAFPAERPVRPTPSQA